MIAHHVVYRLLNRDGETIYIGVSSNYKRRISSHRASRWWSEVDKQIVRLADTRQHALTLEALLVSRYQPKYNKLLRTGQDRSGLHSQALVRALDFLGMGQEELCNAINDISGICLAKQGVLSKVVRGKQPHLSFDIAVLIDVLTEGEISIFEFYPALSDCPSVIGAQKAQAA